MILRRATTTAARFTLLRGPSTRLANSNNDGGSAPLFGGHHAPLQFILRSLLHSSSAVAAQNSVPHPPPYFTSSSFANRTRPHLGNFYVRHRKTYVQIEVAVPEDKDQIVDFLSHIAAEREPTCVSTGTTADEIRPLVERIAEHGLKESYSLIATYRGELVAASVGGRTKLDRSRNVVAMVRDDYQPVMEQFEDWMPSLRARRVTAPGHDLFDVVNNFLPDDVKYIMRLYLSGVRSDFVGGNIIRRFLYEHCKIGFERGLKWTDGHTTAQATRKAARAVGYKAVFSVPYEMMYDNGERIHPRVPLIDGSRELTLFLGRIDEILKNRKD